MRSSRPAASSQLASGPTVWGSLVIHSATGLSRHPPSAVSTRRMMSRSVKMPTSRSPVSTTNTDPIRRSFIKRSASWTGVSGGTRAGSGFIT